MVAGLGASLLEAVWRAEFPFLLRHRQCADRDRPMEGEPLDSLLAGGVAAGVSIAIRY